MDRLRTAISLVLLMSHLLFCRGGKITDIPNCP